MWRTVHILTNAMTTTDHVFDATTATFETDVLQRSLQTPVLVDFWAQWCGPCKALGPVLEKIVEGFNGALLLAKVDTEAERQIAAAFQIRSIPTVFLVKDGQIVDGFQGALPEGQIHQFLQQHGIVPGVAEPTAAEESAPLNPEAEVLRLRGLIAEQPDTPEHQLDLALALLNTEQFDEARRLMDALPAELASDERTQRARVWLGFATVLEDAPSRADLAAALAVNPDDHRARYQLGVRRLLAGEREAGLGEFLEILRRDRDFDDALGKRALLDAFQVIDDAELISRTRRKMSSILF